MIDFILLLLIVGVFYAGFKCGNRWKTIVDMFEELLKQLK